MAAKGAVAGLAAILVVAMVVAVAVSVTRKSGEVESGSANPQINAGTTKAVQSICAPTDYKETCESGLSHANTSNPKELIKAAFEFTVKNIRDVVKNSPLFKEAARDSSTKLAMEICQEVLEIAIDDLKRSFDSVERFDVSNASEYVEDLKTWLSAVITNQETCIDAFDNTTDTGEKMKNLLKTAREMSSNGLAMVTDMSSILMSLDLSSVSSRKLLSEEKGRSLYGGDPTDYAPGEEPTSFIDRNKRSLLAATTEEKGRFLYGGDPTDYAPGEEPTSFIDRNKRSLLAATTEEKGRFLYGGDPTDYAPGEEPTSFIDRNKRSLLEKGRFLYGGDPTDYAPGEEPTSFIDRNKRNLLEKGRFLYGGDPTDYAPGEEPTSFIARSKRSLAATTSLKPNVVVAQDGSGQFTTITAALATVPKNNDQTFVIHVKAGVYKESVHIPKKMNKIVLIGDGPLKTRISGRKNYAEGVKTYHTATVAVSSDDFLAKDIGFENTAGAEGHQAVALRVSGDRAIFYNVHIDGYQDTLYAHTYRQFYRDCSISGTIDFIFGDSLAVFQNCKFVVRKPLPNQACMITAQGRIDRHSLGVIVIQNGDIVAEPALLQASPPHKVYLGRPWKQLSRTIIMQSNIGGFIAPEGWSPWAGTFALDTLYYAEYQNRGPGSDLKNRVKWKGMQTLSGDMANSWTGGKVFGGDEWIRISGVPYVPTMMQV